MLSSSVCEETLVEQKSMACMRTIMSALCTGHLGVREHAGLVELAPCLEVVEVVHVASTEGLRAYVKARERLYHKTTQRRDLEEKLLYYMPTAQDTLEMVTRGFALVADNGETSFPYPFGRAVRLYEDAVTANRASVYVGHAKAIRIVLECTVVLGRVCVFPPGYADSTLRQAPSSYDSVRGLVQGGYEYGIFDGAQALVRRVIAYRVPPPANEMAVQMPARVRAQWASNRPSLRVCGVRPRLAQMVHRMRSAPRVDGANTHDWLPRLEHMLTRMLLADPVQRLAMATSSEMRAHLQGMAAGTLVEEMGHTSLVGPLVAGMVSLYYYVVAENEASDCAGK